MMRAIDPTTEELIEEVSPMTPAALESALDRADAAWHEWRSTPMPLRAEALEDVGERMRQRKETLAALMTREMGKPITEARAEIDKCIWVCRYYADNGAKFLAETPVETDAGRSWVAYEPLGPVLAVMPWNFPFWQVLRFAAPALMAGNVALLKHAPNVPGCARALTDLFQSSAYLDDVFQNLVIDVPTVAEVIADRRVAAVTLTGSVGAGRAVAALAGRAIKPSVLELGGSDPFVVLADADLDLAVDGALVSRYLNSGQSCIAAKRLIVEAPIYERFTERLAAAVDDLVIGDPTLDDTQLGPMAREDLRDTLEDQVQRAIDAGARVVRGAERGTGPGWFYLPTILADVVPGTATFDEEVFGPVASVIKATDADDAIRLADRTRFGLGASIWSRDTQRAIALGRRLASGHISVNGMVKSDPRLPFGGVRESGYGRELARPGIHAFVNTRTWWVR